MGIDVTCNDCGNRITRLDLSYIEKDLLRLRDTSITLTVERDALRASNERMQAANDILDDTIGKLTADNDRLRAELDRRNETQAFSVRDIVPNAMKLVIDERDALLADREVLEKVLTLTRREADLLKASTLNAAYERLRAEVAEWQDLREEQLTELREAAEAFKVVAVSVAPQLTRLNAHESLRAVLAKVTP